MCNICKRFFLYREWEASLDGLVGIQKMEQLDSEDKQNGEKQDYRFSGEKEKKRIPVCACTGQPTVAGGWGGLTAGSGGGSSMDDSYSMLIVSMDSIWDII